MQQAPFDNEEVPSNVFAIEMYSKGQMPPLTILLPLHLAEKTRGKIKSKAFTKPMAEHRASIGVTDHIPFSWSLLCLNRVCVHMKSRGFESQLLVKFPSMSVGRVARCLVRE